MFSSSQTPMNLLLLTIGFSSIPRSDNLPISMPLDCLINRQTFHACFFAATPILSQSGSLPKTRLDFVFSAVEMPNFKASGFSGFGDSTVLKFASFLFCLSTTTTSTPWFQRAGTAVIAPFHELE